MTVIFTGKSVHDFGLSNAVRCLFQRQEVQSDGHQHLSHVRGHPTEDTRTTPSLYDAAEHGG